jgi:hypothetical protein
MIHSRFAREQQRALDTERHRLDEVLHHLGWRSAYAPTRGCAHTTAVEIENDEPITHPVPLPEFWFPLRLRHWVCADCGTAVSPHHVHQLFPLSDAAQRAWWDGWHLYERSAREYEQ